MKSKASFSFAATLAILYLLLFGMPKVCFAQAEGSGQVDEKTISPEMQERAKGYFVSGSESFKSEDYRQAIEQFRKAFDIVRSPEILYNIGRCHEELKEAEDAVYHYELYMRFYPTSGEAEDVERRIAALRESQEKGEEDEAKEGEEQDEEQGEGESDSEPSHGLWDGVRIGGNLGIAGGVAGPTEGVTIPIEILGHYPLLDWLMASVTLSYGHYFVKGTPSAFYSQNQVGIFVGVRGQWPLISTVDIMAHLGLSVMYIDMGHGEGLAWVAGRVGAGPVFQISEHWCLLGDLFVDIGPVFGTDHLVTDVPETEIGFKVGIEYVF